MTDNQNTTAAQPLDLDTDTLWYIHGVVKNLGAIELAHKIADAIAGRAALIAKARAAQPDATASASERCRACFGVGIDTDPPEPGRDDTCRKCNGTGRAAHPESATGTTGASIDTPLFRMLLTDYRHAGALGEQHHRINEIVAHIDAIIGDLRAQLAANGQGAETVRYQCPDGECEWTWEGPRLQPLCPCCKSELNEVDAAPGSAQPDRGAAKPPAAQAVDARDSQCVAKLKKERDGWMEEAEARAVANAKLRHDLDLRNLHQKNDVWFWQGDGTDYPESMSNSMAVVIRADQLKAILAASPASTPEASPASQPVAPEAVHAPQEAAPADAVLVPRTITEAMHVAAVRVINRATGNADWPPMVWGAMLAAAPVAVAPSDAKGGAVVLPLELAQRCLSSMKQAVTFGETGKGRPPSQTCLFEIKELEAILKGQSHIGAKGKADAANAGGLDVREAFEAWHRSKFETKHSTGQPTRDMHNGIYAEQYGPKDQQQMWEAWQAATSAAGAKDAARPEDRIDALRTALRQISKTTFGWDGDCGVTRIADDALYADEQAAAMAAAPSSAAGKEGGNHD